MSLPKIALVVTTIGDGDFLDCYSRQAEVENIKDNLEIIVIPDKKTPSELYIKCSSLRNNGFRIVCPSLDEQESYLKKFNNLVNLIPYNSDNRRNIGFLMALERGCDVLISIDDDNFCLVGNVFYKEHALVFRDLIEGDIVYSSNNWFNPCDILEFETRYKIYTRGFPYKKRNDGVNYSYEKGQSKVRINMGLWLGDPDVDAITWLASPNKVTSFKGKSVILSKNTWTTINSQNTSIHRDLVPCYYFIPMGYKMNGMTIDRFGDIFSGYFVQKCAKHFQHDIRIGTPIVNHRRNFHNYLNDLSKELPGIFIIEDMIEWLIDVKLDGTNYLEVYLSLADNIDQQVEKFKGSWWNDEVRGYFHRIAYCMREWIRACKLVY